MDAGAQERIARNEALFREVNEAIARGLWPGDDDATTVPFRCECGRIGCAARVEVRPQDYERVRRDPRRFIVLPGHELTEAEAVAERRPGYMIVQKSGEAGTIAEQTDPRS